MDKSQTRSQSQEEAEDQESREFFERYAKKTGKNPYVGPDTAKAARAAFRNADVIRERSRRMRNAVPVVVENLHVRVNEALQNAGLHDVLSKTIYQNAVDKAREENRFDEHGKPIVDMEDVNKQVNAAQDEFVTIMCNGVLDNIAFSANVRHLRYKDRMFIEMAHNLLNTEQDYDIMLRVARDQYGLDEGLASDLLNAIRKRKNTVYVKMGKDEDGVGPKEFFLNIREDIVKDVDNAYGKLLKGYRDGAIAALEQIREKMGVDIMVNAIPAVATVIDGFVRDPESRRMVYRELGEVAGRFSHDIYPFAKNVGLNATMAAHAQRLEKLTESLKSSIQHLDQLMEKLQKIQEVEQEAAAEKTMGKGAGGTLKVRQERILVIHGQEALLDDAAAGKKWMDINKDKPGGWKSGDYERLSRDEQARVDEILEAWKTKKRAQEREKAMERSRNSYAKVKESGYQKPETAAASKSAASPVSPARPLADAAASAVKSKQEQKTGSREVEKKGDEYDEDVQTGFSGPGGM